VKNATVSGGQNVVVQVALEAIGQENALGFSLNFDAQTLTFLGARVGTDASGASLLTNSRDVGRGRIGIALALAPGKSFAVGTREVAEIEFKALVAGVASDVPISFVDSPIPREIVSAEANELRGSYEGGIISIREQSSGPSVPPTSKLGLVGRSPEGDVALRVIGPAGSQYVIETSTDLSRWTVLKTVTLSASEMDVVDAEARKMPNRFYRVRSGP
jgi:hypothetical protein